MPRIKIVTKTLKEPVVVEGATNGEWLNADNTPSKAPEGSFMFIAFYNDASAANERRIVAKFIGPEVIGFVTES